MVEKEIASKLRNSNRDERTEIYKSMYDELFSRIPHHPRLKQREDSELTRKAIHSQMKQIEKYINKDTIFCEIGAGDCRFSLEIARVVKFVYAVEIYNQMGNYRNFMPDNFRLILYDGFNLDIPEGSIDIVYSYQLIEHIHLDDIDLHVENIGRILKRGGKYIFFTPHKFSGPHDVSRHFSREPKGFHLKEWTFNDLKNLFRRHCFSGVKTIFTFKSFSTSIPTVFVTMLEAVLAHFPFIVRRKISKMVMRRFYMFAYK